MMIGNWRCIDLSHGEPMLRQATRGYVTVTADADGVEVDERVTGYEGGTGRYEIPANVIMWLMQAVR